MVYVFSRNKNVFKEIISQRCDTHIWESLRWTHIITLEGSASFRSKTGFSFPGWDCWRVWSLFPLTVVQSSSCLRTWCTTSSTPVCWTWRWAPASMAMTPPPRRPPGRCGSASRVRRRRWESGSVACRWVSLGKSPGACVFWVVCVPACCPCWVSWHSGPESPLGGWVPGGGGAGCLVETCSLSPLVLTRGPWTGL